MRRGSLFLSSALGLIFATQVHAETTKGARQAARTEAERLYPGQQVKVSKKPLVGYKRTAAGDKQANRVYGVTLNGKQLETGVGVFLDTYPMESRWIGTGKFDIRTIHFDSSSESVRLPSLNDISGTLLKVVVKAKSEESGSGRGAAVYGRKNSGLSAADDRGHDRGDGSREYRFLVTPGWSTPERPHSVDSLIEIRKAGDWKVVNVARTYSLDQKY